MITCLLVGLIENCLDIWHWFTFTQNLFCSSFGFIHYLITLHLFCDHLCHMARDQLLFGIDLVNLYCTFSFHNDILSPLNKMAYMYGHQSEIVQQQKNLK